MLDKHASSGAVGAGNNGGGMMSALSNGTMNSGDMGEYPMHGTQYGGANRKKQIN